MLSLILLLIIIFIALGIVGFVIKGLFWLFIVAVILFIITVVSGIFRAGGRRASNRANKNNSENL